MSAEKPRPNPPGRRKGVPNKITTSVKAALMEAFDGLGGVEAMIEWGKKSQRNRGEFYKIWSKLLPKEITGPGGGPIPVGLIDLRNLPDADLDTLDAIYDKAQAPAEEPADPGAGQSGEGPPPAG